MKMLWNVWKRNQRKNWKKYRLEKKILAMVMSISTAFALTACVSARPAASDPDARREQAREEIASNSKEDEKEEAIQDTEQEGNGPDRLSHRRPHSRSLQMSRIRADVPPSEYRR